MIRILAATLTIAFMLSRAEAATDADWRLFVAAGANRDFTEEGEPTGLEDALYAAAQHGRSQTEAVARFAARIGVSIEKARRDADFVVAAVKYRVACERAQTSACAFAPGGPFYDLVAREAMEDPTGDLLIVAHGSMGSLDAEKHAAFIRLAGSHSAPARVLTRLCCAAPYLVALLRMTPLSDEALNVAAWAATDRETQTDGWLEAAIEDAERRAVDQPPAIRAALAQLALARKLRLGLMHEAVRAYLSYPAEVRALVPALPQGCRTPDDVCTFVRNAAFEVADDLVAALWLDGHGKEAMALARSWSASAGARETHAAQRHAALMEAMTPRLSEADLFAMFIEGRRPNDPPFDDEAELDLSLHRLRGGQGWLFAFEHASSALSELVGARLRTGGYESMADFLDRRGLYEREPRDDSYALERFAFLFPERLAERRVHWAARIEDAWRRREERRRPRLNVQVAAFADRSDIAARSADSDADGLTDAEEASLGLAIDDPDTDGDGIADAIDPLPLTRYDGNAPKMARSAAFGILLQLMGPRVHPVLALGSRAADAPIAETLVGARDPNRAGQRSETEIDTYKIVADDSRLFAGVRTPFRLMIYSHADVAALNEAGVEIGPPRLIFLFSSHDGRTHYVSWSGGRIGGQFFVRCAEAGGCRAEGRGHSISH